MKKLFVVCTFLWVSFVIAVGELPHNGVYKVDPSLSNVTFNITNFLITSVDGRFGSFSGTFNVGDKLETSEIQGVVDVKSINTASDKRDEHLRSADFFEVEKFPTMIFKSKRLSGTPEDFEMVGSMTIKGISRDVIFHCKFSSSHESNFLTAESKIDRQEFGITNGPTIKNEVRIKLHLQLR